MARWLCLFAVGICACSSASGPGTLAPTGDPGDPSTDAGAATRSGFDASDPPSRPVDSPDAGSLAQPLPNNAPPPKWSAIYAQYFGPSSLGHCGDSGCHDMENNHFLCGQTITQCYQGMVDGRLIDPQNPLMSRLVDPNSTPLAWFGTGGNMPFDKNSTPNPQAAADIGAWIFAGAKSD